jgi:hypothetical protein
MMGGTRKREWESTYDKREELQRKDTSLQRMRFIEITTLHASQQRLQSAQEKDLRESLNCNGDQTEVITINYNYRISA